MTFEEVAKRVADDFKRTMKEEGFETFNEMKRCYCWEWEDIKQEVDYMLTNLNNEAYRNGQIIDVFMYDDMTTIQIGFKEMSWRDFKKLMMAEINEGVQ